MPYIKDTAALGALTLLFFTVATWADILAALR